MIEGILLAIALLVFPLLVFAYPENFTPEFIVRVLRPKQPQNTERLCYAIVDSIENEPRRWTQPDDYHFVRDDGLKMWIANGKSHMGVIEPDKVSFTPQERAALWEVYLNHHDARQVERVTKVEQLLNLPPSTNDID